MIITTTEANGLLAQLAEEVIESYDTGPDGTDPESFVDALLARQRKTTKITKGTISATGTIAIQVTDTRTILSVLLEGQQSVGGYIVVNDDRTLDWTTDIGEDKGQQIRLRKNLLGLERYTNYDNLCTKLHFSGSSDKLSDIEVGPVSPTIATDASYAYFTLAEQYAAYLGWTGGGDALPDNIKVWKENASPSWVHAGGSVTGTWWQNPSQASNGDDGDYAEYLGPSNYGIPAGGNSATLTATLSEATYNKVGYDIYLGHPSECTIVIEVNDTTEGWVTVYDGAPGTNDTWYEKTFQARVCTGVRITAYNNRSSGYTIFNITELQLLEADEIDETSKFVQGAWDNILRCAIGDYDSGGTYTIEYTHANYLIAWDKVSDADDLVARVLSTPSASYSISLLEYGRLLLDDIKEAEVTYVGNAINLAEVDAGFSFDELELGSIVTVIDEDLGIDVQVRVVRIEFPDLLTPEKFILELSSQLRDITDVIAELSRLL